MIRFSEILKSKLFSQAYLKRFQPNASEKKVFFNLLDDIDLKEKFQSKFSDHTYISNDFNSENIKQNFFQYYDDQNFQQLLNSKINDQDYLENIPPNTLHDKNLFFKHFDKKQNFKFLITDIAAIILLLFSSIVYFSVHPKIHLHSNIIAVKSDNKPQTITPNIYPKYNTNFNNKITSNPITPAMHSSIKKNEKVPIQNKNKSSSLITKKLKPPITPASTHNQINNNNTSTNNILNKETSPNTDYFERNLSLSPLFIHNNLNADITFDILNGTEETYSLPEQKKSIQTHPSINYFLQLTSNFNHIHNANTLSPQVNFLVRKPISHTGFSIVGGVGYTYLFLPDYYMTVGQFTNYDFGFHEKSILMNYRYFNYLTVPINISFHHQQSNFQIGINYMYMFNASGKLYIQEKHQQQYTTFSSKEYQVKNVSDGINTQPISFNLSYTYQISKNIYIIAEYQKFISTLNNNIYASNYNLKNIQTFKLGLQIKIH